jgi:hypothetical protein
VTCELNGQAPGDAALSDKQTWDCAPVGFATPGTSVVMRLNGRALGAGAATTAVAK